MRAISFDKVKDAEKIASVLLSNTQSHDETFLEALVAGGVPEESSLPLANAVAIRLGNRSPLLEEIARAPWCSTKTLNFIQRVLEG